MTFAVLPEFIVEAALVPENPTSSTGTLILDDATYGKLDTDWLAGADAWTDITQWVRSFTITRASTRMQGPIYQFQGGTASIVLNNSDGRFDPDNLAGPYVVAGVTQVHVMVPVRIRALWDGTIYPLFRGFADSWQEPTVEDFAPDTGGPSDWTLNASDGFKVFSNYSLPTLGSAVGAGEDSGARINRVLNSAGWYTGQGGGSRAVATGLSDLQATTYGDTVLNLIQIACDSELGQLYMDGAGTTVFRNRHALLTEYRSTTVQATFGDKPSTGSSTDGYASTYGSTYGIVTATVFPCAAIGRLDDDTTIANDIQAQIVGSTNLQEVKDAASIAKYLFPHSYQRTDLVLQADADALNWANWVLYISKDGESRFDTITIDPQYQPADLWPQVLGRDIGDRLAGIRNPPGVGQLTREGFVASISHSFDVYSSTWRTVWSLQDASKYGSFLTLDTAEIGELDENALAY